MKKKQRRIVACSLASIALVASFGFWTAIIGNAQLAAYEEEQEVWSGAVSTAGLFVEQVAQGIEEQMHLAASAVTDVLVPEVEGDVGTVLAAPSFHTDQSDTDLSKWNVVQDYNLSIPSIDLEAPVLLPTRKYWNRREWNLLEKQMQVGLVHGSVAYPHSVRPGERGTFFLAGHSSPPNGFVAGSEYGNIFARVPELEIGDTISLSTDGEAVEYRVRSSEVVPASATEILLQQEDEKVLKIITCFPVGTTKDRMIVTAVLVE
tara:strand:+ start:100 stop:885 length:786 start_codon:yes stop_codon:yes gene_type:complete